MTTYHEKITELLNDMSKAEVAEAVYTGPKELAMYVIGIGLDSFKAKKRRQRRRELRTEVQPEFKAGRTTGSVVFTEKSKKKLVSHAQALFGNDGWQIGDLNLGNMTKEQLLAQADAERKSAKGSIRNAKFYEALAEPLEPGQAARDYWDSEMAHQIKRDIWSNTEQNNPELV